GFAGGEEIRGSRAPWMGFTGVHDGTGTRSTLVMVDDPANPRGPSSPGQDPEWFARNEWFACVCAAPAFSEEIPFGPGKTLTFSYAVVVADGGADPDRAAQLAGLGSARLASTDQARPVGRPTPR